MTDFTTDLGGYPSGSALAAIIDWPRDDYEGLMKFIWEPWVSYGTFKQDGDFYILTTGGWSGNEAIICAMQCNHLFWATCWEKSERGGKFEFKIPKPPVAL